MGETNESCFHEVHGFVVLGKLGEEDGGGVSLRESRGVVVVLKEDAKNIGERDDRFVVVHFNHLGVVYP